MDASSCPDWRGHRGFTLVEVLMSMLVLTVGLIATAGLLVVTTTQQIAARESARSMRLATDKLDQLMKLPFTAPAIGVGGDLDHAVDNYSDSPVEGIEVRWAVTAGPTNDTRALTVRVINHRALQDPRAELSTIIRRW